MKTGCSCCGTDLKETSRVCEYCGFFHLAYIGDDKKKTEGAKESIVKEHRDKLLSSIKHITIDGTEYQWDSNSEKFDEKGNIVLFDTNVDGTAYYSDIDASIIDLFEKNKSENSKIVWSEPWIVNPKATGMVGKEITIPFSYTVNGETINSVFHITPEDTEGVVCHLGLLIDKGLRLNLFLGNDKEVRGHDRVDIEWKEA